jgi:hypothetical protein
MNWLCATIGALAWHVDDVEEEDFQLLKLKKMAGHVLASTSRGERSTKI